MKLKIISILITCLFVTGVQAGEALKVTLKDRVVLKTGVLQIKDIVDSNRTDLDFIKRYGDLKVVSSDDSNETVNRSKFYSVLLTAGVNIENLAVTMNGSVKIERGQVIDLNDHAANKIKNLMTTKYLIPRNDVKLSKVRILPKLSSEQESSLYFKSVYISDVSSLKNSKFNVVIEDVDGRESKHTLYIKMDIETAVLVAKEAVDSGSTLLANHYMQGRQKLEGLTGSLLKKNGLNGKNYKFTKKVSKDEILLSDVLRESILIHEGAMVTLSYKRPHLTVSTMGKLKGTAEIGQLVRVQNVESQRIVKGKLISADLVEVARD